MGADVEGIRGGIGADTLVGNDAPNSLVGGLGADTLSGAGGNDTIDSADLVRDVVNCGDGADTLSADDQDAIAADCESVSVLRSPTLPAQQQHPAGPSAPLPVTPSDTTAPRLGMSALRRQTMRTVASKGLKLSISCSEVCTFEVAVRLNPRLARSLRLPQVIGRARGTRTRSGKARVTVKLSRAAARKLRRRRNVKVVVQLTARDVAGNKSAMRRSVRLR